MQLTLLIVTSLHVLSAVFWAGTAFAVARLGGTGGERLFGPQMGAAVIVVLTGGYLWKTLHEGALGPMERFLGIGVGASLLALILQAAIIAPKLRKLSGDAKGVASARSAIVIGNRLAAVCLALAAITMAGARYA
ncbi:MAG: hypothetical protein JWR80_5271 [Bradyrhizobium sp.]|nr:hypothetical protein [Bradyrhizobium sp.]